MKNEALIFSTAGQQNDDATGQMKFSPNKSSWNRKKTPGFSTTEKKFSTEQLSGVTLLMP